MFHWPVDIFLEVGDLFVGDLDTFAFSIVDILAGGFCRKATFSKRTR